MRNKTVIICAVICAVLFAAACVAVIIQYGSKDEGNIRITLDGNVIYEGASKHAGGALYINAEGKTGVNIIRIDENGVCVESADCPNGECVAMGYLKSKYFPVVCLPNKLMIQYTNTNIEDGLDAVSQ